MKRQDKIETNTPAEKVLHIICLLIPIITSFLGYFISIPLWKLISKQESQSNIFSFFVVIVFFSIPSIVIFIRTRNIDSMIIDINSHKLKQK